MSTDLLIFILGVFLAILGWALAKLIAIERKLAQLCTWQDGHEQRDDERHQDNLGRFDALFRALEAKRQEGPWR